MHALCKTIMIFWLLLLAKASLYPTKIIRSSAYIAGQAALVTWVEDGTKPRLASLGRLRIDLCTGRNVSIHGSRTLATLLSNRHSLQP